MQIGHTMTSLSQRINNLKEKGFDVDFELKNENIIAKRSGKIFSLENLTILKSYRFEGESNPGNMSILYVVETNNGIKGIIIDAYRIYANNETENISQFLKKVKVKEKLS